MFIGIHGVKEAGVSYWCQNMTWEKQALASSAEYNDVKSAFYGMKYDWPGTYLLTPKQAAVVYEAEINDFSFNCKHITIGVIQDITLEDAEAKLQQQIKEKPKMYISEPQILLRWNPKGLPEVFKDKMAGLDVIIRKSKNSSGSTVLQVDVTNNTQLKAVACITDGNVTFLKGPYVIQPGSGLQNLVFTNVKKIEFYSSFDQADKKSEQTIIDELKAWIKGEITNPPAEGKKDGFDAACMCVRG
jgi:hypothetical protein